MTDAQRAALRAERGLVFAVDQTATHDGPGLRLVAYLKGCPLRCVWCHSPESQFGRPQVVWYAERCCECQRCVDACPEGVRSTEPLAAPDLYRCTLCGDCVDLCPAEALEIKGTWMTAGELAGQAVRQRVFFDHSGGGVTLSGGEPTYQADFAFAVLALVHEQGIHTALETTGLTTWATLDRLAEVTDLFLYDIKHVDEARHRELTGVSNRCILDNLERLVQRGSQVVVRVPCIPGHNDGPDHIAELVTAVRERGVERISLLPYNPVTPAKYAWLQRACPLNGAAPQTPDELRRLTALATAAGLEVVAP